VAPQQDEETLADLFWAVAGRLRRQARETVAPFGVTPGQARALGALDRHGGLRHGTLSEHLRISPRSGTEVVDALEERGLVRRSPDPDDRRATLVALTGAGEEVAAGLRAARRAEAESLFGTLPPADREALTRILRSLGAGREANPT
jgi:DNA-binding MarR family transcriptional regulator